MSKCGISITITPAKPMSHCRPTVDPNALLQDDCGQRDRDQRRGKGNGGDIGQWQSCERGEISEHAGNAERATAKLAERPAGANRGSKFAADGINNMTGKIAKALRKNTICPLAHVTQLAHQRRHCGKWQQQKLILGQLP